MSPRLAEAIQAVLAAYPILPGAIAPAQLPPGQQAIKIMNELSAAYNAEIKQEREIDHA